MAVDRGAHHKLTFHLCERGFLLRSGGDSLQGELFAFDRIEDVAAWLVDEYAPTPSPPAPTA